MPIQRFQIRRNVQRWTQLTLFIHVNDGKWFEKKNENY